MVECTLAEIEESLEEKWKWLKNLDKDVFTRSKKIWRNYETFRKKVRKGKKKVTKIIERIRQISSKTKRKTRGNTCRRKTREQENRETSENE